MGRQEYPTRLRFYFLEVPDTSPTVSIPKEVVNKLGWKKTTKLRLLLDEEAKTITIEQVRAP